MDLGLCISDVRPQSLCMVSTWLPPFCFRCQLGFQDKGGEERDRLEDIAMLAKLGCLSPQWTTQFILPFLTTL